MLNLWHLHIIVIVFFKIHVPAIRNLLIKRCNLWQLDFINPQSTNNLATAHQLLGCTEEVESNFANGTFDDRFLPAHLARANSKDRKIGYTL